ncbi:MAG: hypothetical protein HY275_14290 [Gemmatimonadetes bacterium]|nr:hypothetical protein [Gemmatimonadota bacterium]
MLLRVLPFVMMLAPPPATLRLDVSEAQAALRILDDLAAHREPAPERWQALHASDGYRRLKRREAAMRREFTDDEFDAFLRADSIVARRAALAATLRDWQRLDVQQAARQAYAWLPAGARIRATIYFLIKPRTNSFVFETGTDPAIMLYLDPAKARREVANQVVHELHHIGYAAACPERAAADSSPGAKARGWLGAFGEGEAMLAAAGSVDVHPHAVSAPADRARWDHDVADFDADLARVQEFLTATLDGTLRGDAIAERAVSFYGVQGPWYTVGYVMSATIVRESGKAALLASMCRPVELLRAFNTAATRVAARTGVRRATWDPAVLDRLDQR